MDYEYGQGSDPNRNPWTESNEVMLASSCPKKKAGRKKFKETRHPVYRGVRQRNGNRWVCEVRDPNNTQTRIWLGTYPTPEMAARAHDVAALALRGPQSACLNFADSAWRLPRLPPSADAAEIRRVASQAAEAFRPAQETVEEESRFMVDQNDHAGIMTNEGSGTGGGGGGGGSSDNYNYNYVDEEAVFDMPGLLSSMAEGMLLPPPHISTNYNQWDNEYDNTESDQYGEVSLWNY